MSQLFWFMPPVLQNFHLPGMMETELTPLVIFLGTILGLEKSPRSKKRE